MGYRLLGAHVNATVSGLPETISDWKPPLVVLLDHSDVWHDVKAGSPSSIFVGRFMQDQSLEPNFNDPNLDPIQAAHDHCDKVLPWAERMGETYDFWQGVNEPIISSPEAMERYAAFDAERARLMDQNGFRVVVGSFSVGNPELSYWNQFVSALEAARQYNGALALHECAWPSVKHDWRWYLLRHRKVYGGHRPHGWAGLPDHLKDLPLLITECGLDGLIEQEHEPRGWQVLYGSDPDEYLKQLSWYDRELMKDPYVIGAAIYCLATPDPVWHSYDIWPGLAQTLAQRATPIYRLEGPELPEPPELLEPPPPPPPPSPPLPPPPPPTLEPLLDEDAMLDQILARLDHIIYLLRLRLEGSIGKARMKAKGEIVLTLRTVGPDGEENEVSHTYRATDAGYSGLLAQVGGLRPGESKQVPPWPELSQED